MIKDVDTPTQAMSNAPPSVGLPDQAALPCLLLVEDSQTTTALITKYLSGNYKVLHDRDGEDAWTRLEADRQIGLVITDINMPRLNGHQLLVRIRKTGNDRIRSLPVIVMTTAEDNVDRNLAFLNGANDFITKPIDEMELQARVNVHYKLARTIRELEHSRRALAEQATTDPLTKLANRRAFFDRGNQHLAIARRYKNDLSVLLIDIDYFKKVNDTYGHKAGDDVLIIVANTLTRMTRAEDSVARLGGEEFSVLLPDTNALGAAVLAERIRAAIERERIMLDGKSVTVTISMGVASFLMESTDSLDQLLSIADKRLYLAKQHGRNRICVTNDGKSRFAV
jgi:two-component system, cell cycle response regulator